MAVAILAHGEQDEWVPPSGEQVANRLFAVVLAGICGVIVLMVMMGGWWVG